MAAGIATLKQLKTPGFFESLDTQAEKLITGLASLAKKAHIPVSCARSGAMLGLFFIDHPVKSFADAKKSNLERFSSYYKGMLENGIYLAPSQFEAFFISAAHDDEAIEQTLYAAEKVFANL
jgi:glutamate-1-semialdehyde 2,1-aminomutase